jgi:hypothetical protein
LNRLQSLRLEHAVPPVKDESLFPGFELRGVGDAFRDGFLADEPDAIDDKNELGCFFAGSDVIGCLGQLGEGGLLRRRESSESIFP